MFQRSLSPNLPRRCLLPTLVLNQGSQKQRHLGQFCEAYVPASQSASYLQTWSRRKKGVLQPPTANTNSSHGKSLGQAPKGRRFSVVFPAHHFRPKFPLVSASISLISVLIVNVLHYMIIFSLNLRFYMYILLSIVYPIQMAK